MSTATAETGDTQVQGILDAWLRCPPDPRPCAARAHVWRRRREQIDALNGAVRLDIGDFDLPPIEVPAAALNGDGAPVPLVDSRWPFSIQCQRLIASKAYEGGAS